MSLITVLIACICIASAHAVRRSTVSQLDELHDLTSSIKSQLTSSELVTKMQLTKLDSNLLLVAAKLDRLIEANEHLKTSNHHVHETMLKLDQKLELLEKSINVKFVENEQKVSLVETLIKSVDTSVDLKLKKVLNVASNGYEETKSLKAAFDGNAGQSGRFIGESMHETPLQVMGKQIKEQMNVHNFEVGLKLTTIEDMALSIKSYLETVENNQLILNDNFHSLSEQMKEFKANFSNSAVRSSLTSGVTSGPGDLGSTVPLVRRASGDTCQNQNLTYFHSKLEYSMDKRNQRLMEYFDNVLINLTKKFDRVHCSNIPAQRDIIEMVAVQEVALPKPKPTAATTPAVINTTRPPNKIRAESGDRSSSNCVSTAAVITPTSCSELRSKGATCNGMYILMLKRRALRVYCDMADNGGGWTVLMRRGDFQRNGGQLSFEQNWSSYRDGFGDLEGQFWLGLEQFHTMSTLSSEPVTLKVELEAFDGDHVSLEFGTFRVNREEDGYRLIVGDFTGQRSLYGVAAALLNHNGSQFSTNDRDLSRNLRDNCPSKYRAGFWFDRSRCCYALLTGVYLTENDLPPTNMYQGIRWSSWKGNGPLKAIQMKIRTKPMVS